MALDGKIIHITALVLTMPMLSFTYFLGQGEGVGNLTQEQLIQIEREPILTLENCISRQDFGIEDLCGSFYQHLDGKCKRLDYLPSYCGTVVKYNFSATVHAARLSIQQGCIRNPPSPNETELVKICKDYVIFNSSYYNLEPQVKINSIDIQSNESNQPNTLSVEEQLKSQVAETVRLNENPVLVTINMTVKNPGIGGIHVDGISYNIIQKGKTVLYGHNGQTQAYCATNYIGCVSYTIDGLTNYVIELESKAQPGKIDLNNPQYLVNGSLDYGRDNSEIQSKAFSINYPQ